MIQLEIKSVYETQKFQAFDLACISLLAEKCIMTKDSNLFNKFNFEVYHPLPEVSLEIILAFGNISNEIMSIVQKTIE